MGECDRIAQALAGALVVGEALYPADVWGEGVLKALSDCFLGWLRFSEPYTGCKAFSHNHLRNAHHANQAGRNLKRY